MKKPIKVINKIEENKQIDYTSGLFYHDGILIAASNESNYKNTFCGIVIQSSNNTCKAGDYSEYWSRKDFIPVEAEIIIR